ncbi:HD domain-containing protein [Brevibacillus invocatus]|uniref:HD domain-containing protein n=1 Tax=Brevibacillus invocatus TaxID=173959 RepID=UPI00203BA631|nr:HD domain-containing protein [Brevibacillus invocatus]MCM3079710.1 HD domain-containing protein [Brevibacillus invocatus]MCM3431489.1 HD domain-containing protein [Brevibacillus invocatus]
MDYVTETTASLPERLVRNTQRLFDGQDPAHDWQHNLRVMAMCERIGREEGADMALLRLAALLHDIGRAEERRTGECHAEISARIAGEWLREEGMDSEQIMLVQKAILAHRFRKESPPTSLEEKILFDADKLDSIGAIGVARAFAYSGVIGQPIHAALPDQHTPFHEYEWKLVRIKDRLYTATARQIAEERHLFMKKFFEQWNLEIRGIR